MHMTTRSRVAALVLLAVPVTACGAGDKADDIDAALENEASYPPSLAEDNGYWPAPTDVLEHVRAAGLNLGPMGTALHFHPQLRLFVGDTEVPVASNIGVDPATGAMSALHTHEGDGTIHIEAASLDQQFTLGQLFTQWDVELTRTSLGGIRSGSGALEVTVDGQRVTEDPADLILAPEQQIEIRVPDPTKAP